MIRLCVLLWEHPDRADAVRQYEDEVLALLPDHGARLVSRDVVSPRVEGDPLEVQVIELPDQPALDAYLADPRRVALTEQRDAAVARTQVLTLARR
ncbi:DUF1330 domain-containing protein [Angustibacter luteus]|uniref:DUF1330 domain-containing protein n=1 Tax=Angustibacter luteus TaxID=658456 RepID=A0ABW1JKR2_9ACTN